MSDPLILRNPRAMIAKRRVQVALPGEVLVLDGNLHLEDVQDRPLIVVEGGDGTLQRVITQLLLRYTPDQLPPVAVLPGGATNMSALDLNTTRTYDGAVARLTKILDAGEFSSIERSLVRVEAQAQAHERYGWFFGLGAICTGIERWGQSRARSRLGSRIRTASTLARGLLGRGEYQSVGVEGDLECQPRRVFAMMATSLDRLLFGYRPYWNTSDLPGLHSTWLLEDARALWLRCMRVLRGDSGLAGLPGYLSEDVSSLRLAFTGPYTLDGELYHNAGTMKLSLSAPVKWQPL